MLSGNKENPETVSNRYYYTMALCSFLSFVKTILIKNITKSCFKSFETHRGNTGIRTLCSRKARSTGSATAWHSASKLPVSV